MAMKEVKEDLQELLEYKRRARYMLGKLHKEQDDLLKINEMLKIKIARLEDQLNKLRVK